MSSFSRRLPVVLVVLSFGALALASVSLVVSSITYGEFLFRSSLFCGAASAALAIAVRVLSWNKALHPRVRGALSWWGVLAGGTFAAFLAVPFIGGGCNAAQRMQRMNDLNLIAAAMHGYADKHAEGRFPPAASRDKDGKPLLSSRVLLLPHLGESALYDRFHLGEPWDSPHNLALLQEVPAVYRPTPPDRLPPGHTRFVVFVGPGTPFGIAEGPRLSMDFPNGTTDTLLATEAAESVPWTKPADLTYSPDAPLPALGVPWRADRPFWVERGRFAFARADGSVSWGWAGKPDEERLRQLIAGQGAGAAKE